MKYVFFFYLMLGVTACQVFSDDAWKEKIVLSILVDHFNDRVVLRELTPVAKYEIWSKGRMSRQRLPNGQLTAIPPPPPIDTIIYGNHRFEELYEQKILTVEECDWMKSDLENFPKPLRLSQSPALRFDLAKTPTNQEDRLKVSYYRISSPLFNEARNKVLISVDNFNGSVGVGYVYVFEKEGKGWKVIYKKQTWIT